MLELNNIYENAQTVGISRFYYFYSEQIIPIL